MIEVACGICGANEPQELPGWEMVNEVHPLRYAVCRGCGGIYGLASSMSPDNHMSSEAKAMDPAPSLTRAQFSGFEMQALARFRTLSKHINLSTIPAGQRMLDVGCGVGSFLRLMGGAGWEVQGVEPDRKLVEAGVSQYGNRISSDVESLFLPPSKNASPGFDLISVFGWLDNQERGAFTVLSALSGQLREQGLLYVEVTSRERLTPDGFCRFLEERPPVLFSRATLVGLLEQAGFTIIASGFSNERIWMLSRKEGKETVGTPSQPWENPEEVVQWAQALLAERAQGQQNRPSSYKRLMRTAASVRSRIVAKHQHDPQDFGPWLKHRVTLQHSKILRRGGLPATFTSRGKYLTHFGWHDPENAGDAMLYVAVRRLFDKVNGPFTWQLEPITNEVNNATIARCNAHARGIVIGGGGLLLQDTNANKNSGWQWNLTVEQVKRIEVPIVVFAIGYNQFRGQGEFDGVFKEHLNEVVRRSAFFGLRERGNLAEVARYLEPGLESKLCFQPCPTTVLRHLFPQFQGNVRENHAVPRLALNAAFDRHRLRFGEREDEILAGIARAVKQAERDGWEIYVVNHLCVDANVIPWLVREGVKFQEVELSGKNAVTVMRFYQKMKLTIGMRGHAQMIPFGLGNGIISLISHDKLGRFLQDINHPEWGVDVYDIDLESHLTDKIRTIHNSWDTIDAQLTAAQDDLWRICQENQRMIQGALTV